MTNADRRLSIRRVAALLVAVASLLACQGSAQAAELDQLPNLKPLPPRDIGIWPTDEGTGERALHFTTSVMNLGDYPLEVVGYSPSDPEHFVAQQCIAWIARACTERREAGRFFFDNNPTHNHWHFEDFAAYELRQLIDGHADMTDAGLAAASVKASFCLADFSASEENPRPLTESPPVYGFLCVGVVQGISPGWQDTYYAGVMGQQILIEDVPDGDYALVIRVDPDGNLAESTKDDNASSRRIEIANGGTEVYLSP